MVNFGLANPIKDKGVENWQERTALLVGEDALETFARATVAVVGLGGVGAYAAEMLARAGVGRIVAVDSDTVGDTNRNRQLLALESTVGRPKTEVLAERLKDINPDIEVVEINEYITPENVGQILGGLAAEGGTCGEDQPDPVHIDFLVDAIDTLAPKLALINHCVTNGIPLVSSMGSGAKYDLTKVRIADISKSFNCPLAYMVRKRLRREYGISKGFKAVFSEELPIGEAIVKEEGRNKKSNVGTISYLPAVFGCACAQAAIAYLRENHVVL